MTYLVVNCNHWIGFHIVEHLLEKGHNIDGVNDENGNDTLSMFFGRNSSFSFFSSEDKKQYDTTIIISESKDTENIESERTVIINPTTHEKPKKNKVYIKVPLLFGEWMPMNEKGMYRNNEFIPFDSDYFHTKAIYIKDFTKVLSQWLKMNDLKSTLVVESSKNKENKDVKLENSIYIRDNVPIEDKLKQVLEHYNLYKKIY